jgi:hypothetical protein
MHWTRSPAVKTSSLIGLVVLIVLAVSLASIWFYPSSQDFMSSNNTWNGLKDFSRQSGIINLDSLNGLDDSTGETVLIAIPYLQYSSTDLLRIRQFIERGGNLLLMDDFGHGNDILDYLGSGDRFDQNMLLDPLFCYKNPSLPYITDFSTEIKKNGINAIAFNHATVLKPDSQAAVLAWSSASSYLDLNSNGNFDAGEPTGPFPVAASLAFGSGKVTLVSDPSLIINAMNEKDDNSAFIHYLVFARGTPQHIWLDRSHLSQAPLDVSRSRLEAFRRVLSSPYILLGLIAVIFILVIRYTLKKGEIFG